MNDMYHELKNKTNEVEEVLKEYLPETAGYQKTVIDAMNYSVEAGGKRLRPVMLKCSYTMCGGKGDEADAFAAAIEMIHTYSLVHDDLPEMDNDMLRRGRASTHARYGAGMAVLAGDGLLNYAFETALKSGAEAEKKLKALECLAKNSGIYGMVGGQCLDVEAEEKGLDLNEEELLFVYENKTSALLKASLCCGAILAGASDDTVKKLEMAAAKFGLAFQLQDDILDVTGKTEEIGKPAHSDEKNGKKTWLSYLGLEAAEKEQKKLSEEAVSAIEKIEVPEGAQKEAKLFLTELIKALVNRRN